MPSHNSVTRLVTWITLLTLGSLLGVGAFFWVNHISGAGKVVAGGVTLAGTDLDGLGRAEVATIATNHSREVLTRPLLIRVGDDSIEYEAADLGYTYDVPATVEAVMSTRRTGGPMAQFASWITTPLVRSEPEVVWDFDVGTAREALLTNASLTPEPAVEPTITTSPRGSMIVTPGVIGTTIDVDDLVAQLKDIDLLDPPDHIDAHLVELEPTVADGAAELAASELNEITSTGVRIRVNGGEARLSAEHLRSHLRVEAANGRIESSFDLDSLQGGLEAHFAEPVSRLVKPEMTVIDGIVRVVREGRAPLICCAEGSAGILADLVLAGNAPSYVPVEMKPRQLQDPLETAYANGSLIVEEVSTFTTNHSCCENRVKNIHRIADIVDGAYLLPGETFSLNGYVGPRTARNGFFPAGAIRRGRMTDEIGGGVSQFATTFFNAAFFAGLDFEQYRSHSIYFSRYPYGREATISMPGPDLVIENTTEYPLLIDTSYTDRSITVSMYSTANVQVDEVGQRTSRRGACTHVETDRRRTYRDGTIRIDTVFADYRPAEGIDCNGKPIPETAS